MPTARGRLGDWGEGVAGRFLQGKGYQILETKYRCTWGEVDIVARDGDELVFVEVRTRRDTKYGTPEESVTRTKARRLILTAQDYIQRHADSNAGWRIDLVAIRLDRRRRVLAISHHWHAVEG